MQQVKVVPSQEEQEHWYDKDLIHYSTKIESEFYVVHILKSYHEKYLIISNMAIHVNLIKLPIHILLLAGDLVWALSVIAWKSFLVLSYHAWNKKNNFCVPCQETLIWMYLMYFFMSRRSPWKKHSKGDTILYVLL